MFVLCFIRSGFFFSGPVHKLGFVCYGTDRGRRLYSSAYNDRRLWPVGPLGADLDCTGRGGLWGRRHQPWACCLLYVVTRSRRGVTGEGPSLPGVELDQRCPGHCLTDVGCFVPWGIHCGIAAFSGGVQWCGYSYDCTEARPDTGVCGAHAAADAAGGRAPRGCSCCGTGLGGTLLGIADFCRTASSQMLVGRTKGGDLLPIGDLGWSVQGACWSWRNIGRDWQRWGRCCLLLHSAV